jgi:hypothetical protein
MFEHGSFTERCGENKPWLIQDAARLDLKRTGVWGSEDNLAMSTSTSILTTPASDVSKTGFFLKSIEVYSNCPEDIFI